MKWSHFLKWIVFIFSLLYLGSNKTHPRALFYTSNPVIHIHAYENINTRTPTAVAQPQAIWDSAHRMQSIPKYSWVGPPQRAVVLVGDQERGGKQTGNEHPPLITGTWIHEEWVTANYQYSGCKTKWYHIGCNWFSSWFSSVIRVRFDQLAYVQIKWYSLVYSCWHLAWQWSDFLCFFTIDFHL